MKIAASDRRLALRHDLKVSLRVRVWKSKFPEKREESVNLSSKGIFFATNSLLPIGEVVEVLLKMPEQITGEAPTEWLWAGHVVRLEAVDSPRGKIGVGVQFDCYEISRIMPRS